MNIKNNITNYLFDKDYVVCAYDNYVYISNYNILESFSDKKIMLKLIDKIITIYGNDLIIVKITKEEILIKGCIKNIEMDNK